YQLPPEGGTANTSFSPAAADRAALLQFVEVAGRHDLARFHALDDLDQVSVACSRLDDALRRAAILDHADLVQAGNDLNRASRHHHRGRVFRRDQFRFGEHAGAEQIARIGDLRFNRQRASLFTERGAYTDD